MRSYDQGVGVLVVRHKPSAATIAELWQIKRHALSWCRTRTLGTSYIRCCIGCSLSHTMRSFLCGRAAGVGATASLLAVPGALLSRHKN